MTTMAGAATRNAQIVGQRRQGRTIADLAVAHGVSKATVAGALRAAGFVSPRLMPVRERIEARVEYEPNTGCWLWPGATAKGGYGSIAVGKQKSRLVHVVMFEAHRAPAPTGLHVLHRCDTPACCNPDHLFVGTQADNMRDCSLKRRHKLHRNPDSQNGDSNPGAKLSSEAVREIRASSATSAALARTLGVSRKAVANARNGHTWRHL
jgi:hypothetical protein